MVAVNASLFVWVLNDSSEDFVCKVKGLVVAHDDLHTLLGDACLDDCLRRGKNTLVDEELVGTCLLLLSGPLVVKHERRLGACSSFVK